MAKLPFKPGFIFHPWRCLDQAGEDVGMYFGADPWTLWALFPALLVSAEGLKTLVQRDPRVPDPQSQSRCPHRVPAVLKGVGWRWHPACRARQVSNSSSVENYSTLNDAQQGIGFTGRPVYKPEVGALGLVWARIGTETPLGVGGIEGKK